MAKKFLVDLNLAGNELQNAALETRVNNTQNPAATGEIFFNTTDGQVYISPDGSAWQVVGKDYSAGNGIGLSGTQFFVEAGDGLSVKANGNGLDVDSTVVRTTGTQTIGGAKTFTANAEFDANVIIDGDLTVNGTTTTIDTETIRLADNIIELNSGYVATNPSENAGLEVNRGGTEANVQLRWNESTDRWQFTNDGTQYENIPIPNEYTANTGTVTSVSGGTGLTGTVTTSGSINVDYAGTDNIILAASNGTGITVATGDRIMLSDATDNTVKYVNISQLPFTNNVGDITAVTAGVGLGGGGNSGGVTLTNAYYRRTFSIASGAGTGTMQTIIANCATEGIVPTTVVVAMAEKTASAVIGVLTDWEVDITGNGVVKAFVPNTGAYEITVTAFRA